VTKRLSKIAPWQAGKLFALIYFFLSLLFVIPLALVSAVVPMPAGPGHRLGTGFLIFDAHDWSLTFMGPAVLSKSQVLTRATSRVDV
jgi:hypothetical protein